MSPLASVATPPVLAAGLLLLVVGLSFLAGTGAALLAGILLGWVPLGEEA